MVSVQSFYTKSWGPKVSSRATMEQSGMGDNLKTRDFLATGSSPEDHSGLPRLWDRTKQGREEALRTAALTDSQSSQTLTKSRGAEPPSRLRNSACWLPQRLPPLPREQHGVPTVPRLCRARGPNRSTVVQVCSSSGQQPGHHSC